MKILKINLENDNFKNYAWDIIRVSRFPDFKKCFLNTIQRETSVKNEFKKCDYSEDDSFAIRCTNGDLLGCILMKKSDILTSKNYHADAAANRVCYNIKMIILEESLINKEFINKFAERFLQILYSINNDEQNNICNVAYIWFDSENICKNVGFDKIYSLSMGKAIEFISEEIFGV